MTNGGWLPAGAATDQGEALFLDADAREAYFPLASNFLTQQNQAFCGVASMVMVFNALQLPAPAVPAFDPYRTFTQDNVLDARTEAVLPVGGSFLFPLEQYADVPPMVMNALNATGASRQSQNNALAAQAGLPRLDFKANVRKLKALGLTESLPVGYRLSPRGKRVLAAVRRRR